MQKLVLLTFKHQSSVNTHQYSFIHVGILIQQSFGAEALGGSGNNNNNND